MSLARIYHTKKSRKVWTCSACRREIPIGSPVISFAVGFRGPEQRRCADNPACYPKNSELESSLVATVYAAIEGADIGGISSEDDATTLLDEIADACDEVADEYESNEMYDVNPDLQERAEQVRSAGDELRSWSWDGDEEPEGNTCPQCDGTGKDESTPPQDCHACDGKGELEPGELEDEWLERLRESVQQAIDEMDLP